ncbi:glycosyltransferase family 2 protein [Niabella drilacis]|uniref:Glycosyltransferase involved in cell wall bisynthesis n=1 Tax=Niabella drilacis (strain DSM 25811 / CCM 8410 / CCUG 62505 / LMG 26954 / E90) TaxID=1285928 RepID=A0A1G6JV84_NIADE|nr:glycosyltransferase family A protein [Niabella drilacis]SDC21906.1 Glycosyltransferase involved in cell wall bisynthesis [Niabella drilacis]
MNAPLIDVIIAVYNGQKFIGEAIASVQAQTCKALRILVADDGSEDQTATIVESLMAADQRIELLKYPHRGVSATLNAAIAQGSAPFIAFLDADDLWNNEKLEKQMEALLEDTADICFCMIREFETLAGKGAAIQQARPEPLKGYSKTAFLGKRVLFETYGGFDEQVSIGDFVEWFSRVIRAGGKEILLSEVLAYRRIHDHNTTLGVDKTAFLGLIKAHLDKKRKPDVHAQGSDQ